jgi:acyl carrier protein
MTDQRTLREVFAESLDISPEFEAGTVRLYETPGWDSMGHMSLMIAIEDEYGIELDADRIVRITTYDLAVEELRELGCAP